MPTGDRDTRFQDAARQKIEQLRMSPAELSRQCGFANERRVSAMLNNSNTPNLIDAATVADRIGMSLDALFGIRSDAITPNDVIFRYSESGGAHEAFSDIIEHCDQYRVPRQKDRILRPIRLGAHTEVNRRMNGNIVLFQVSLAAFCQTKKGQHLVRAYKIAAERGILVEPDTLDGVAPKINLRVFARFVRATVLTTDQTGKKRLLNFPIMLGS